MCHVSLCVYLYLFTAGLTWKQNITSVKYHIYSSMNLLALVFRYIYQNKGIYTKLHVCNTVELPYKVVLRYYKRAI